MINNSFFLLFLLIFTISYTPVFSQEAEGCDGARYRYLVFEDFEKIDPFAY